METETAATIIRSSNEVRKWDDSRRLMRTIKQLKTWGEDIQNMSILTSKSGVIATKVSIRCVRNLVSQWRREGGSRGRGLAVSGRGGSRRICESECVEILMNYAGTEMICEQRGRNEGVATKG